MDWLFFGGLGILWAAFLLPSRRKPASPWSSVEEFGRSMDVLAETERHGGRWVLAPKKGELFMGPRGRARARARARRRRVFTFLLETMGLTFLMGLFPPLRGMWFASLGFALLLGLYVWLLLTYRRLEQVERPVAPRHASRPAAFPEAAPRVGAAKYAASSEGRQGRGPELWPGHPSDPRPLHEVLGGLGADELVHVVVRRPEEVPSLQG